MIWPCFIVLCIGAVCTLLEINNRPRKLNCILRADAKTSDTMNINEHLESLQLNFILDSFEQDEINI